MNLCPSLGMRLHGRLASRGTAGMWPLVSAGAAGHPPAGLSLAAGAAAAPGAAVAGAS